MRGRGGGGDRVSMRSPRLHLALQSLDGTRPLRFIGGPSRPEVDAHCAELRGAPGLRGAREHVPSPRDLEPDEPGRDDRRAQLRFQQSTGDSPLPEINVALRALGDGLLHEDVGDLESAAGP